MWDAGLRANVAQWAVEDGLISPQLADALVARFDGAERRRVKPQSRWCRASALEVVESLDIEALPREAAWVDLNYWRRPCPMVERMRSSGRVAQEGDRMLHHQADLAFAQFRRALVSR